MPLYDELLQALAGVGFGRVDVALRVDGDAVHAEEHAGLAAAVAEVVELFHRLAVEDADVLVDAVSHVEEALLRVLREGDVPHRAVGQRVCRDEHFLHELAFAS